MIGDNRLRDCLTRRTSTRPQIESRPNALSRRELWLPAQPLFSLAAAAGCPGACRARCQAEFQSVSWSARIPPAASCRFAWDAKTGTLTPEGRGRRGDQLDMARVFPGPALFSTWPASWMSSRASLLRLVGQLCPCGRQGSQQSLKPIRRASAVCHVATDHTGARGCWWRTTWEARRPASLATKASWERRPWSEHYKGYPGPWSRGGPGRRWLTRTSPASRRTTAMPTSTTSARTRFTSTSWMRRPAPLMPAGTYKAEPGDGAADAALP